MTDQPTPPVVSADSDAWPRPFRLVRDIDDTGVSGRGFVADGVLWPNGTATIHWRGEHASIVHWPHGLASVVAIHGHDGRTRVVFQSTVTPDPEAGPA